MKEIYLIQVLVEGDSVWTTSDVAYFDKDKAEYLLSCLIKFGNYRIKVVNIMDF